MTKLNDTQLIILSAAAQREDHGVAAIDERAETRAAITKLLKAKLLQTTTRSGDLAVWGTGKDGAKLSLAITPAGLRAIGDEDGAAPIAAASSTTAPKAAAGKGAARKGRAAKPAKVPAGKAKAPAPQKPQPAKAATAKGTAAPAPVRSGTKLDAVIGLLRGKKGASIAEIMEATGWQAHSVRGAISGALKKKLGLVITSEVIAEVRRYRIAA